MSDRESREASHIQTRKAGGAVEFGTVKDGSDDRYYGFPTDLYDEAWKGLSGDKVCIARIPRKQLLWLAKSVCEVLTEPEWDELLEHIEVCR